MSWSKISKKNLRRIEIAVGEPLLMAFTYDGRTVEAVTPDDRHVMVRHGVFTVEPIENPVHWTTCPTHNQSQPEEQS